jgi:uncharacterized delta-60 repeat protein
MRRMVWLSVVSVLVLAGAAPAAAAPGDLDPTFGDDGTVVTDEPLIDSHHPLDVLVQDDGKVVVVGGFSRSFVVARFAMDGALDPTFSDDGWTKVDFQHADYGYAVAVGVDSHGGLLIGGKYSRGLAVVRLWPGGRLDRSFGSQGRALVPGTSSLSFITDLVIDPFDRVVFGGWEQTGSFEPEGTQMLVGRLTTAGDLDPAFHGGRLVTLDPPQASSLEAIGLLPDGRIVGVGSVFVRNGSLLSAVRLWPGGRRERSFGRNGIARVDLGRGFETPQGLAVLPGGAMAVTGGAPDGRRLFVARLTSAGRLDADFDGDGVIFQDLGRGDEAGSDLVVDGAGRLVVMGHMRGGSDQRAVVLRYTPTGDLDPTFGGNGWTPVNPSPGMDRADAIALDPTGDVVIALRAEVGEVAPLEIGVARLDG